MRPSQAQPALLPLRCLLVIGALAAIAVLALTAASASAAEETYARNYESQITGFAHAAGIGIDPADHPWIVDSNEHLSTLITEYAAFPSLTPIAEQDGQGHFRESGSGYVNAAIDGVNGDLYVANTSEGANIQVFDPDNFLEEWPIAGGTSWVAADNSGGLANGRLYVATYGERRVQAFEPGQVPAPFSCGLPCEGYVEGNLITGTPSGPFGNPYDIEVDEHGDIFVLDQGLGAVDQFKPSGEFVRAFAATGVGIALDPSNDHLLVMNNNTITEYSASGEVLGHLREGAPGEKFSSGAFTGMAVNSAGDLYVSNNGVVDIFSPAFLLPKITYEPVSPLERNSATLKATVSPNGGEDITSCHFEYGTDAAYGLGSLPCSPDPDANPPASNFNAPTEVHADVSGLTTDTTYHYRLVAANAKGTQVGEDQSFTTPPAVAGMSTEPVTELTNESATLNGSYTGDGLDTSYYFEYGTSTSYGHDAPVPPTDNGTGLGHQTVPPVNVTGLVPGTTYHFRLVAGNSTGVAYGLDETFTTYQAPTIEGFSTSDVTATSAVLHARINPQTLPAGTEAECRFEYGTSTSYGSSVPCPESLSGTTGQAVEVEISGLQSGATYHFRVLAHNQWGDVASEDQAFEFFPPACPNSALRQQTGAGYLPDCRAYELVSPSNANGTILFTGGPNTGRATSPSRFAFGGAFSSLPGADVINTAGDLYVATRTSGGWQTKYIGPSGDEAGCVGESPNDPWSRNSTSPTKIQANVITDPSMSRFIDFYLGTPVGCISNQNGIGDATGPINLPSTLGHLWSSDGASLGALPAGLTANELAAFECPNEPHGLSAYQTWGLCRGDVAASSDLSHFFFSSNLLNFTPGGSAEEPGGAYDYDVATGTLTRISALAAGGEIAPGKASDLFPAEAGRPDDSSPFIHFAAISEDGSHVLMTNAVRSTVCENYDYSRCKRFTDNPIHLYMSIADAPALDVSESQLTHENLAVKYVGMTPDGSRVYFTSTQHLTDENPGHIGASLYMWEADKALHGEDPLTLISKANPGSPAGAGNTGACAPAEDWTTKCGVTVYSPYNAYAEAAAGRGGNGVSDSPIAANGDIYFFSPEQLDGDHGVAGEQNLYDYRNGALQFVTSFHVEDTCPPSERPDGELMTIVQGPCGGSNSTCLPKIVLPPQGGGGGSEGIACSEGPLARLQISPDDTHMAFVSAARVTGYDNVDVQGSCRRGSFGEPSLETHCTEMYSYDPVTGSITCNSCNPNGEPPTSHVYASQNGRFMTDDGRTFFGTEEALVPADTNETLDVYEYAAGRPRLITPGTGIQAVTKVESIVALYQAPGLTGVSADGTDVYFSTFDVITSEDHNGHFLKFYDARTNGGFAQPPLAQPCAAAEECHGPGTEAPVLPAQGTAANLTGGNLTHRSPKHRRKHKRAKHKRYGHHTRRGVR